MRYIYIACPYTHGDQAFNVKTCTDMADLLAGHGFTPFVPLLYHFWHMISPHHYKFWTELDLRWVEKCDAVLRLSGHSPGADAEVFHAQSKGIPVFFSIEEFLHAHPSPT